MKIEKQNLIKSILKKKAKAFSYHDFSINLEKKY